MEKDAEEIKNIYGDKIRLVELDKFKNSQYGKSYEFKSFENVKGYCVNVPMGVNDLHISFEFTGLLLGSDYYKGTTYYSVYFLIGNNVVLGTYFNGTSTQIINFNMAEFGKLYTKGNIYNCSIPELKSMCEFYLDHQDDSYLLRTFKESKIMDSLNSVKQPEMDTTVEEAIQLKKKEKSIADKFVKNCNYFIDVDDADYKTKVNGKIYTGEYNEIQANDEAILKIYYTTKCYGRYPGPKINLYKRKNLKNHPNDIKKVFDWFDDNNYPLDMIIYSLDFD